MPLPPLVGDWLPASGSPFRSSLAEIGERFVDDAPFQGTRELVFKAIDVLVHSLVRSVAPELILLGGSFVSHSAEEAPGAILVVIPTDFGEVLDRLRLGDPVLGLLTLRGVIVWQPVAVGVERILAVGGMVDTVLQRRDHLGRWHALLSVERDSSGMAIPATRVGYVEVTP